VLPIGGLKEKLTAAGGRGEIRARSERNKNDLLTCLKRCRSCSISSRETIDDVLELALLEAPVEDPRATVAPAGFACDTHGAGTRAPPAPGEVRR